MILILPVWNDKKESHPAVSSEPRAPLSVEFSRQEHWSGSPFPPPGDLPDWKPGSLSPQSLLILQLQMKGFAQEIKKETRSGVEYLHGQR